MDSHRTLRSTPAPAAVEPPPHLEASAATSAGAAARPFVSRWALGAGTTAELATELQALLCGVWRVG